MVVRVGPAYRRWVEAGAPVESQIAKAEELARRARLGRRVALTNKSLKKRRKRAEKCLMCEDGVPVAEVAGVVPKTGWTVVTELRASGA